MGLEWPERLQGEGRASLQIPGDLLEGEVGCGYTEKGELSVQSICTADLEVGQVWDVLP